MTKWWENETPATARTDKDVLRWYKAACKLQISRPDWEDEHGEVKHGMTVTADVGAPAGTNAAFILREVLKVVEHG